MSILIEGMEMPNNCRDCPLEDAYEGYNCRIVEKSANWGLKGRPSWCPLVPVPPHGRLIDADALIIDLMDRGIEGVQTDDWHEIQQAVADAPTIIPASEVVE